MSTKSRSEPRSIICPGNNIMVSVGDETYQVTKDDKRFARIEALVRQKKWAEVFSILGAIRDIKSYTEGDVVIDGEEVLYKGKPINSYVADKILKMLAEGTSGYEPLAKFLDKVMQNEFPHVRENLYKFLEYGNIPITANGDFLGYKSVNDNYLDCHSKTFDNTPGNIVRMKRSEVVSDPTQGCERGLHVGVKQYVSGFGGSKTIIVLVDPRNVVSVPADYGHQKMRTCEYYVVADCKNGEPLTSEVYDVDEIPIDAPVSTGTGLLSKSKPNKESAKSAVRKTVTMAKHVEKVKPLRDAFGRFIKKKIQLRDAKGHFIKRK
jgi:hypothetical protein